MAFVNHRCEEPLPDASPACQCFKRCLFLMIPEQRCIRVRDLGPSPTFLVGKWEACLLREGLGREITGDAALLTPALRSQNPPTNHAASTLAGGCDLHVHVHQGHQHPGRTCFWGWRRLPGRGHNTPGAQCFPGPALGWKLPRSPPAPCCLHCVHWSITLSVCPPEQPFTAPPLRQS